MLCHWSSRLVTGLLLVFMCPCIVAAEVVSRQFTAVNSGPWNAASTWDLDDVPTADDLAIIPSPYAVSVDQDQSVGGIVLGPGGQVDLNNGSFLAISGTMGGGTISGELNIHAASSLRIANAEVSVDGAITTGVGASIRIAGDQGWGTPCLILNTGGSLSSTAGGLYLTGRDDESLGSGGLSLLGGTLDLGDGGTITLPINHASGALTGRGTLTGLLTCYPWDPAFVLAPGWGGPTSTGTITLPATADLANTTYQVQLTRNGSEGGVLGCDRLVIPDNGTLNLNENCSLVLSMGAASDAAFQEGDAFPIITTGANARVNGFFAGLPNNATVIIAPKPGDVNAWVGTITYPSEANGNAVTITIRGERRHFSWLAGDNAWSTPGAWSPAGFPDVNDWATKSTTGTVLLDNYRDLFQLDLSRGTLDLQGYELRVDGGFNWHGGTLQDTVAGGRLYVRDVADLVMEKTGTEDCVLDGVTIRTDTMGYGSNTAYLTGPLVARHASTMTLFNMNAVVTNLDVQPDPEVGGTLALEMCNSQATVQSAAGPSVPAMNLGAGIQLTVSGRMQIVDTLRSVEPVVVYGGNVALWLYPADSRLEGACRVDAGSVVGLGTITGQLHLATDSATVAPGYTLFTPCSLTLNGGLRMDGNSTADIRIQGAYHFSPTPGSDSLIITGGDITLARLDLHLGHKPPNQNLTPRLGAMPGTVFTLIDNRTANQLGTTDATTFRDLNDNYLREGATVTLADGTVLAISYQGGDNGRCVTMTVLTVQPLVFTAVANGHWSIGSTWDRGMVPTAIDTAVIPTGLTINVHANNMHVGQLTVASGGVLNIDHSSTFNIDGNNVVGHSTIAGALNLEFDSGFLLDDEIADVSGTINLNGIVAYPCRIGLAGAHAGAAASALVLHPDGQLRANPSAGGMGFITGRANEVTDLGTGSIQLSGGLVDFGTNGMVIAVPITFTSGTLVGQGACTGGMTPVDLDALTLSPGSASAVGSIAFSSATLGNSSTTVTLHLRNTSGSLSNDYLAIPASAGRQLGVYGCTLELVVDPASDDLLPGQQFTLVSVGAGSSLVGIGFYGLPDGAPALASKGTIGWLGTIHYTAGGVTFTVARKVTHYTWNGSAASWTTQTEWTPATGFPGANDHAIINQGTVSLGGDQNAMDVTLTGGALALAATDTLNVTNNFLWSGGTIAGGQVALGEYGSLLMSGGAEVTLDNATIRNSPYVLYSQAQSLLRGTLNFTGSCVIDLDSQIPIRGLHTNSLAGGTLAIRLGPSGPKLLDAPKTILDAGTHLTIAGYAVLSTDLQTVNPLVLDGASASMYMNPNYAARIQGPCRIDEGRIVGRGTVDGLLQLTSALARVIPGQSGYPEPATLTLNGGLQMAADSHFVCRIQDTGSDKLVVTSGAISLGTLDLQAPAALTVAPGTSFVLIDNQTTDLIATPFTGLAEGAPVTIGGMTGTLSYSGGPGNNDVTLTFAPVVIPQEITGFTALGNQTYGDGQFTIIEVHGGGSTKPVVFTSSDTTVATTGGINGTTITITGAGTTTITANQDGDGNYLAATPVAHTLTVAKAPVVTATATDARRAFGTVNPTFSGTLIGVVNGDAISATYISSANASTAIGVYGSTSDQAITPVIADAAGRLANYLGATTAKGTLTITAASSLTQITASAAAPLPIGRFFHTATTLPSGKILVTGGATDSYSDITRFTKLASCIVYDPATGSWSDFGAPMLHARHSHTATLLPSGKILVAGGVASGIEGWDYTNCEMYDPTTRTWSEVAPLPGEGGLNHAAVLLPNGKVLVTGGRPGYGSSQASFIYDPGANLWTSAADMPVGRFGHSATLLPGGKVLVAGGDDSISGGVNTCAFYDPATNIWTASDALLAHERFFHGATLLTTGQVLLAGGADVDYANAQASCEAYDPVTNTSTALGSLSIARSGLASAVLPSGQVLVIGGRDSLANGRTVFASCEILSVTPPATPVITTTGMPAGRLETAFEVTLVATNNPTMWVVISGTLPAGLTLDANSGVISGTPTTVGLSEFTLTAANAGGTSPSQHLGINVVPQRPVISTTSLPDGTVDTAYQQVLEATNNPTSWVITTGSLPAGLILGPNSGEISGTPTTVGTATFTVTAANAGGTGGGQEFSITIRPVAEGVWTWTAQNSGSRRWTSITSSSDGVKLAATAGNTPGASRGGIYTSADGGVTWTAQNSGTRNWSAIASSSDGAILLAGAQDELTYTSTDSGIHWSTPVPAPMAYWFAIASSSDATRIAAVDGSGWILISPDRGTTWDLMDVPFAFPTPFTGSDKRYMSSIAISSDGSRIAAAEFSGYIYTSTDGGAAYWTQQRNGGIRNWTAIASSSDGTRLAAAEKGGCIHMSFDGGITWVARNSGLRSWIAIASSSDGTRLAAAEDYGRIYTSSDNGATWIAQTNEDRLWQAITSSCDGTRLAAAEYDGQLWTGRIVISATRPVVTTPVLPNGTIQAAYRQTLAATHGPSSWVISAGSLPEGLALEPATGVISGTPTVLGDFPFTVTASNNLETSAGQALSITVVPQLPAPPVITTVNLPDGLVDAAYQQSLTASNNPTSWAIISGYLPVGLTLQTTTGAIQGTPITMGTYWFTVTATNAGGTSVAAELSITNGLLAPVISTTTLPDGRVKTVYEQALTASLHPTYPTSWTISSGNLPTGLTLDPASGLISGIPETQGHTGFSVTATNAGGAGAAQELSITIGPAAVGVWTWTAQNSGNRRWTSITSSSDGTKLAATVGSNGLIYTSADSGVTWTAQNSDHRNWTAIASSSDGERLLAGAQDERIHTSTDSGVTWTVLPEPAPAIFWHSIASSSDGTRIAAVGGDRLIFTSPDQGATWHGMDVNYFPFAGATDSNERYMSSIASSSDGARLAAAQFNGCIYTSTDGGTANWTQQRNSGIRNWIAIASSSDGTRLAAAEYGGHIHTSSDGGATWTTRMSGQRPWTALASSSDGTRLAAADGCGPIYTSSDSGATWIPQTNDARLWESITSSSDGTRLAAAEYNGQIWTATLSLAPPVISTAAVTGVVGTAFTYSITASPAPTSYAASGLPDGLTVNTASDVISGTPTAAGTSHVTLSASNANGTGTATLELTVNPATPINTWALELQVTHASDSTLTFGMAVGASEGWDGEFDALATAGSDGTVAWLAADGTHRLSRDLRQPQDWSEWILEVVAGAAADITVSWDAAAAPARQVLLLQQLDAAAAPVPGSTLDMARATGFTVPAGATRYYRITCAPPATHILHLYPGWNLISLPLEPLNPALSEIFAAVDANAYLRTASAFVNGQYQNVTELHAQRGYWLYALERVTVSVTGGGAIGHVDLQVGWNQLGPAAAVTVSALAAPLNSATIWSWNHGSYRIVTELRPGSGYWLFSPTVATDYHLGR